MKRLRDFHQYLSDDHPHALDAIQCVNLTFLRDLRRELFQSDPATINLLTDTLEKLKHTAACRLFGDDELLCTEEPLPGLRACEGKGMIHLSANDPDLTLNDYRHYVSHDLLPQVVSKLAVALSGFTAAEEVDSMTPATMEAILKLNSVLLELTAMMNR